MSYYPTKVNGYTIQVAYESGVVHIKNDAQLKSLLSTLPQGALRTAEIIKHTALRQFNHSLNISNLSLAIEILGHVYPDKILGSIGNLPLPGPVKSFVGSLSGHTAVIDCGESDKDNNRWIWDTLSNVIGVPA